MKISAFFISLFLFFHGSIPAFAQHTLVKHFTINNGLSSNTVYQMLQDKDGFIWFGNDVGVTRYDGKRFQNFTVADGLSDNEILVVKSDSKGRIWFLALNGTVSYWLNEKIYNSSTDSLLKNIVSNSSFIDFFEDNEHRLWFVSQQENLIVENNKVLKLDAKFSAPAGAILNASFGQIIMNHASSYLYFMGKCSAISLSYKIKQNSRYWRFENDSILFVSNAGIVIQKDSTQNLIIPFVNKNLPPNLGSATFSFDNLIWVASIGNGVYCFDYKNRIAKPIVYLKNETTTNNCLADREGNVWFGTLNDGLYMIPANGRKVKIFNETNGLPNNQCFAINKLKNGSLIVGLNKGKTITISGNKIGEVKTLKYSDINNRVQSIKARNNDVWIGFGTWPHSSK